jgi:hypothetical protein
MLLLVGALNVVLGLTALVNPRVVTVSIQGFVVGDVSAWGWIYTLLGVTIGAVSVGLFAVREWARWLSIVLATVDAIAASGFFTAYPLWAMVVIALNVIVIYQLSMHWSQPGEGTG